MENEPISLSISLIVDNVSMILNVKSVLFSNWVLKLNDYFARFIEQFGDALKANIFFFSVDSLCRLIANHPDE